MDALFKKKFSVKSLCVLSVLGLGITCTLPAFADKGRLNFMLPGGPFPNLKQTQNMQALHTYDELVKELFKIQKSSQGSIEVMPAIDLVEIPLALKQTIVKSVMDETDADFNDAVEKIGKSHQGRVIYGVKAGTGARKVLVVAQQHGNEFHSGEAALKFIKWLGNNSTEANRILSEITIIVIPRLNVDGGEPDPVNCPVGTAESVEMTGEDCAHQRHSVVPDAGLDLGLSPGDPIIVPDVSGVAGVAGVGYDLNRFYDPSLMSGGPSSIPIVPIEAQLVNAIYTVFQPGFLTDNHGMSGHVVCDIDESTITAFEDPYWGYAGECTNKKDAFLRNAGVFAVPQEGEDDNTPRVLLSRKYGATVLGAVDKRGFAGTFRFVDSSLPTSLEEASAYAGSIAITLETRSILNLGDYAYESSTGNLSYGKLVELQDIATRSGLVAIANGELDVASDDGGWLSLPTDYDGGAILISGDVDGDGNPEEYLLPWMCYYGLDCDALSEANE